MSRNPDWTRDELILALDLYFRMGRKQLNADHPEVVELSKILNQLPIHSFEIRKNDFRNVEGVSMKLGNFSALDPDYQGTGLARGSKLDKVIWNEFSQENYRLRMLAKNITTSLNQINDKSLEAYNVELDDEEEFPEGKILTRLHKYKERQSKAAKSKKQLVLKKTGKLSCEVCGFDFLVTYGKIGNGFAECHHMLPIADLVPGHRTRVDDLAIVCSNCHSMIHKSRPMLSISQLKEIINFQKQQ